jgi:DNA-binding CsgD family transcriptional regulator
MTSKLLSTSHNLREAREVLNDILTSLHRCQEHSTGEAALDRVAECLGMPWAFWVRDTSSPYFCPEMDAFARRHGWPEPLMKIWWSRNAALKMPFYIRCRFEHLPFVASVEPKRHTGTSRMSPEQVRITEIIRDMNISAMLVVPLHLPKGQVAMVLWAGARPIAELDELLSGISGDLLGVGHQFMRIVQSGSSPSGVRRDEQSRLTPREWDCLRTLAQGYREAEVAQITGISKLTVRFHLDNAVHKFGCKSRAHAVAMAAQLGLLGPIGS